MKKSPLAELDRLPANPTILSQLERMHAQLQEAEQKKQAADPVEFILVTPVLRDYWLPPEGEVS